MPSDNIITIDLKPYLKDWLISRYGKYPLVATRNNMLGQLIKYFLEKIPLDYIPRRSNASTCEIILPYDANIEVRGNVYVPETEEKILEKLLEEIFNDLYYSFINSNYIPRTERSSLFENGVKDLTERFMNINKLNPDNISHETLIKRWQRHKTKNRYNDY
jgi:hypothetical protein